MIQSRYRSYEASESTRAGAIERQHPDPKRSSLASWLSKTAKLLSAKNREGAFVLLSGGADLVGFRVRVAQSQARADLLPSCFDQAMLVVQTAGPRKGAETYVTYHVPLRKLDLNTTPVRNAVAKHVGLPEFLGDWSQTPNLALLRFPATVSEVVQAAEELGRSRLSEDLVTPTCAWLSYLCGAKDAVNPLLSMQSIPSAAFLEACYGRARQDLSPGVISRVVTPESIWQARFWADQYDADESMAGHYVINQPAAAVSWPHAEHTHRGVHG